MLRISADLTIDKNETEFDDTVLYTEMDEKIPEESEEQFEDPEMIDIQNEAASKIQIFYRKHHAKMKRPKDAEQSRNVLSANSHRLPTTGSKIEPDGNCIILFIHYLLSNC